MRVTPNPPPPRDAPLQDIKRAIVERAKASGFDAVRVGPVKSTRATRSGLAEYLAEGRHGDMGWMATTAHRRASGHRLWPEARSAIVLATNYGPATSPLEALERPRHGAISAYAQTARDYHDSVKKRLRHLARWIAETHHCQVKLFCDTAPLMEKPLAEQAGIGWQGKHSNLVSRDFGSWLLLGEILTDMPLEPDAPEQDHCGSCHRCLDICPTDAFPKPYQLDARRCIAYLTIEHQGHIPRSFRKAIGNRVFGCDDCLAVCPWNKYASRARELQMRPRLELMAPELADLAALDDQTFREIFAGSPIKRLGRNRLVRNVLIAIGNAGEPALGAIAEGLLDDPSPLVRAMAVWALGQLLAPKALATLAASHRPREGDAAVQAEWALACEGELGED